MAFFNKQSDTLSVSVLTAKEKVRTDEMMPRHASSININGGLRVNGQGCGKVNVQDISLTRIEQENILELSGFSTVDEFQIDVTSQAVSLNQTMTLVFMSMTMVIHPSSNAGSPPRDVHIKFQDLAGNSALYPPSALLVQNCIGADVNGGSVCIGSQGMDTAGCGIIDLKNVPYAAQPIHVTFSSWSWGETQSR